MDILKVIDCHFFFKLQLTNRYLSPISINFCKDLITCTKGSLHNNLTALTSHRVSIKNGNKDSDIWQTRLKFLDTYKDYAILPFSARFTLNNNLTDTDIKKLTFEISDNAYLQSWQSLLGTLFMYPSAFEVFFRYIFVDQY